MSRTSSVENTGILSTWLRSPITPMAVPSDAMADRMGSSMANTEPNTSRRTSAASSTPRPVPPNDWRSACSAIWPDTATWRCGPWADSAALTKSLDWVTSTFWPWTSKVTLMKAVVPLALTWWGPGSTVTD